MISPQSCWSGGWVVQQLSITQETFWSPQHRAQIRDRSHSIPRKLLETLQWTLVTQISVDRHT